MTPREFHEQALDRARRVLVEEDDTFHLLLAALLVNGNVLVEGVPGTAKTLMALVHASQSPVEFEGTYPLTEAHLDRLLCELLVSHRSDGAERGVLRLHHGVFSMAGLQAAGTAPLIDEAGVLDVRRPVQTVHIHD